MTIYEKISLYLYKIKYMNLVTSTQVTHISYHHSKYVFGTVLHLTKTSNIYFANNDVIHYLFFIKI